MAGSVHAIDFLAESKHSAIPPVCALFGDEPFLKRLVRTALRQAVLTGDDAELSLVELDGQQAAWSDVADGLSTVALFGGGQRLVVVDDADDFVTKFRDRLEDYVARPRHHGVLVLVVDTWPSNTRLYKAVAAAGLSVDCAAPKATPLVKWLVARSRQVHGARLDRDAAEMLVEIVGPELGLLDQELAKLAVSVGPSDEIDAQHVRQLVGGWRAKTTWDMLDTALQGDAPAALEQLDRLLLAGDEPIGLLGQIGPSLRRFAAATRLVEQAEHAGRRPALRQALEKAGIKPFVLAKAEAQLKQLGRQRGGQFYRWLLEADIALKGTHSQRARARTVLEQLIVRMSSLADPRRQPADR